MDTSNVNNENFLVLRRNKYLFLGAHPDDIELGAGATIAKATSHGVTCFAGIFSTFKDSHASFNLIEESLSALKILGVNKENTKFFDFPVRDFPDYRQQILQTMIDNYGDGFDTIFVPSSSDIHQDHAVISKEALRGFKFSSILGYELPWNIFDDKKNVYNRITQEHLDLKISALKKFDSQRERFYMSPSATQVIASFRGLQIKSQYAEAFELYRGIIG
jgi:LmbE family N-acetylglucosaminyl deacetylase